MVLNGITQAVTVTQEMQFANYAGIIIKYDPPKNGNCQFDAIADQLSTKLVSESNSGITGDTVRERVVKYMDEFEAEFISFHSDNKITWRDYLNTMKITTTFGDHLTLHAACRVFGVRFLVLDVTDESHNLIVSAHKSHELNDTDSSSTETNNDICLLGYYPENKGSHYVSLQASMNDSLRALEMQINKRIQSKSVSVPSVTAQSTSTTTVTSTVQPTVSTTQPNTTNSTPPTSTVTSTTLSTPKGVKQTSWQEWTKSRPWLCTEAGKVFCEPCRSMTGKNFPVLNASESREETAFTVMGVEALTSKKLLKKIDKHARSKRHEACVLNLKKASQDDAKNAFAAQSRRFEEINAHKIAVTERVFRVAYLCAKENMPFAKHPDIIDCHRLNGADMGSLLYSAVTCHDIVSHITSEMKKQLIGHVLKSGTKFSIMVDESTTVSAKCSLIIYIRVIFDGDVINYFLDLVELQDKSGHGIADCILQTLAENGLSVDILKSSLIGFESDGASSLRGIYSGAAVRLQEILGIEIVTFHCMAHRLELAVHYVVKSQTSVSHFRVLCDEFHSVYSHSTKRLLELETCAKELSVQILKIGKVFDVRWLMSSYTAVNALWIDLAALQLHMNKLSKDSSVAGKDKAKFSGLERKLKTWIIVAEMALMRDVLCELSRLSLHLQHRDTSILTVGNHLEVALRALEAMKKVCGSTLQTVMNIVANIQEDDDTTEGIQDGDTFVTLNSGGSGGTGAILKRPSKKDRQDFDRFRKQFLQGLMDNIKQRFPDVLLKSVEVLNTASWPMDDVSKALYGDTQILQLAGSLRINVSLLVK